MKNVPDFVKKGTWNKVLNFTKKSVAPSPHLLIDREVIREKADLIGKNITNSRVFYAIKANPERSIIEFLDGFGIGFEIASEGELQLVKSLGIEPDKVITGNTVKTIQFIQK